MSDIHLSYIYLLDKSLIFLICIVKMIEYGFFDLDISW